MKDKTRKISKANLDKRIFVDGIPNTLTFKEFIRKMEKALCMGPEPIELYGDMDLIEYEKELISNLKGLGIDSNELLNQRRWNK